MQKQKEWSIRILIQPVHGRGRHLGAWPLEIAHVRDGLIMKIERAVVNVETAAQSESPVQHETAHERRGTVAGVLQNHRKRCSGGERDSIVLYPISERVCRSEQRDVRWQSKRNERAHLREQRAVFGERINVGRRLSIVLVAAEVIGA